MRKLVRSLLATGVVFGLAACGDDVTVSGPPEIAITGITVNPPSATIAVGQKTNFAANVQTNGGSGTIDLSVTWESSNSTVASVSASGEVTGNAAGSALIVARSVANNSITGGANVTVSATDALLDFNVTPTSVSIVAGGTAPTSTIVSTSPGATVSYATSTAPASVCTATSTGANPTITAVAPGTCVVTITATGSGSGLVQNSIARSVAVTVTAQPVALNSLSLTPTTITMGPGGQSSVSAIVSAATGATVTYANNVTDAASGCPGKVTATTDPNTGATTVTGVAAGSCVLTITASGSGSGLQSNSLQATVAIDIIAAQISINSITSNMTGLPVVITNVAGQIEINLNFQPNGLPIDSVVVRINQPDGMKRAALQSFGGTVPAAGLLTLSVNTANFIKNAAAPDVTIDYLNGPTTVAAQVYPVGSTGSTAVNCQNNPTDPNCAAPVAIVLNNVDGWTADITKPSVSATSAAGVTYWGGPTANATAILYPVVYTPGRSVSTATWSIGAPGGGSCAFDVAPAFATSNNGRTHAGRSRTFGYASNGAQVACTGYENVGGGGAIRDNILVPASLDNQSNPYATVGTPIPGPAFTTLIPNVVVTNSTPDSLRLDYAAPSVSAPSLVRTAPAVTGWVNASFNFVNFASTDLGVGLRSARDRMVYYNAPGCGGAVDQPVPSGTGADIPECATNFIGATLTSVPAAGVTPTYAFNVNAPYDAYGTESDRLNNLGQSVNTPRFGVDKTNPSMRRGPLQAAPALVASVSLATGADTTFAATKPVAGTNVLRYEYLDDRAGFYNAALYDAAGVSAQTHMLSTAGHMNPTGLCLTAGANAIGATFVTAPGCSLRTLGVGIPGLVPVVPAFAVTAVRMDGWQPGAQVDIPAAESYYGYSTDVTDAAGNTAPAMFQKLLVNQVSPFATGLGIPANLTAANLAVQSTFADSAEVVAQSVQFVYPNTSNGATTTDSLRYSRTAIGTAFDDVITSPFAGPNAPTTGAPYARRIEIETGAPFPASNIAALGTPTNVKPTKVTAWSWNHGSTLTGGPLPGVSVEIPIPGLNVENGSDIAAFNAANPTIAVNHFRVITTVAPTNQFFSTVPLRAQAASPTGAPNPPFARVDFYRLSDATGAATVAPGVFWSYLGSASGSVLTCSSTVAGVCGSDQGTYRSWVYQLPSASYVNAFNGSTAQTGVVAGDVIMAVGVIAAGDAVATLATTMVP